MASRILACLVLLLLAGEALTKVTLDSLKAQLTEMGFAPTTEEGLVNITVKKGDHESYLYFTVDEHQVWMNAVLQSEITNLDAVPAKIFRSLLAETYQTSPAFFSVYDGKLVLFRTVSNRQKAPDRWKSLVEDMDATVRRTVDLWSGPEVSAQWEKGPSPSPAK